MSIRLYIKQLPTGMPKRDAERIAANQLAAEAGIGPISHSAHGAPIVDTEGVFISISHNTDKCVLAVSNASVGVDIESPRSNLGTLVARVSAPAEAGIDPLHLWTAKEAVFKCAGVPDMVISQVTVSPTLQTATAHGVPYALDFRTLDNALICIASPVT